MKEPRLGYPSAIRIAADRVPLEEKMTMAEVIKSLEEVTRNLPSLRKTAPVSPCSSAQPIPCWYLSVFLPAIPSGIRWQATAVGREALIPATASSREEKPTAIMEDASMRSRSYFSFGYAITRRS